MPEDQPPPLQPPPLRMRPLVLSVPMLTAFGVNLGYTGRRAHCRLLRKPRSPSSFSTAYQVRVTPGSTW